MWPSAILKWPESLPCFRWRCLLPWSHCLGAHPMTPSAWRLLASWSLNFRSWRSGARGMSGLPQGSMTCSLGHHPIGPDWPIIWTRPSDSLGQSWLHGGRQLLSWRLCGLWLHEFQTWCWTTLMGRPLCQHLSLQWWSCLRAVSMPQLLTDSVGGPVLHWLPPCHISQSRNLSWSCLGPNTMWT
jgi:hypothetical protein